MTKTQLITSYSSLTFATLHVLSYSSTVQVDSETFNVSSHQNGKHNKLSYKMKILVFTNIPIKGFDKYIRKYQ